MALNAALLPEFDQEVGTVRKTLERIPADKFDWKPHPKSMSMIHLATHLATIAQWAEMTMKHDVLDMAPGGVQLPEPEAAKSVAELLERFDKHAADGRAAIAAAGDSALMANWSLQRNGMTLMTLPRTAVLRTWVMNHLIHHRAQLGVYLRMNDIPVPSVYGPSADEGQM